MLSSDSPVLGSWKEIAAYLGKSVRTVQRWERNLGMPIRRPAAHNQGIVIAIPTDLDEWIQRQTPSAKGRNGRNGNGSARLTDLIQLRANLQLLTQALQQTRKHTADILRECRALRQRKTSQARLIHANRP